MSEPLTTERGELRGNLKFGGEGQVTTRDLLLPLIGGSVAVLRAPIPMTEENYNHLTAMLEAMKKAIVKPQESTELRQRSPEG